MSEPEITLELAAQATWDQRVAGSGVPLWADLDEDTKRRWRSSFNANGYLIGSVLNQIVREVTKPLERLLNRLTRKRESVGRED